MTIHNSLIECLFHYAATYPTHDAVVTPSFKLSYAQFALLVKAQASQFIDAGISADSVIGIRCADDTQHLLLCLAAIHVGATSFTIPSHEAKQIQKALIDRCAATDLVDEKIAVTLAMLDHNIKDSKTLPTPAPDSRLLFSTSGTTGEPKLVIHKDCDLVAQAHRHVNSGQERFVCLASIEHNFVKRHRLYCVAMGATNVFVDAGQESLVTQCQSLNVNVLHVSAYQAQELLAIPDIGKLSHIRLKLGGSHVNFTLRQQLRHNISHQLLAGYGTTETGAIAFTDPEDSNAAESVGQPLPGIEIRSVSPAGKILGSGEHGELVVRCKGMFRGYLGKPELTAERLKDGWFHTGDIGYLDHRQRIHLSGRSDDMFVFNSMNIYPQDIESQICQHPDVTDAAVLPKTSSVHGNIPVALVVFTNKAKPDLPALRKFMKQQAGIRSPRQFTVVDEIPRNLSGKISRNEALKLFSKSNTIRSSIVQALVEDAAVSMKPSLITAFENGDKDITLNQFKMDSLARMNLLITLETDYDTIIQPQDFLQFRSLDEVVSRVLSSIAQDASNRDSSTPVHVTSTTVTKADIQPYLITFFQRTFSYCHTVTQLNKALGTLEYRLTPTEVECLDEWHVSGQLIPSSAAAKFHTAISQWLMNIKRMMLDSAKQDPEPFTSHRIAPTVTHYCGPGSSAEKTLLICFSESGGRGLMMPNAVLLQHTNSARYDLLIIAEPLNEGYRLGVPSLGKNVTEVCKWIARLDLINNYRKIRTLGCSAGGYAAVIAGYLVGAEMAACVGGRFHSERYLPRILDRMFTTWRAVRKGRCSSVLLSYSTDKNRDRKYARFVARLSGGNLVGLEFTNGYLDHLVLKRLVERGELAPFLANTIFAEMNDDIVATNQANMVMSFPSLNIRPLGEPG